jgi:hypothetical protein
VVAEEAPDRIDLTMHHFYLTAEGEGNADLLHVELLQTAKHSARSPPNVPFCLVMLPATW